MNFPSLDTLVSLATAGSGALGALGLNALLKRPQLTAEALQTLTALCDKIVLATEQGHGAMSSAEKKQLAEQLVSQALSAMGIPVPAALIDVAIEEAVAIMNRSGKQA